MARVGESIDARLLRLDPQVFKSIESAGASTGAMYSKLGSNVSDALSGYLKVKEGRSALTLDTIAEKWTKVLKPGDPGYDPNLPGKTGFDKNEYLKEAKATGGISLKTIKEVLNQHEKETEVENKAYVDTYLKQEQLAATQGTAQTNVERLLEAQKLTGATAEWQQNMLAQSKAEADETKAQKVLNKEQSSLIFAESNAILEQLKLVPVEERAALRNLFTEKAAGLFAYGAEGRAMFDQLTKLSEGIITARETKAARLAEEKRKKTETEAGVLFQGFRQDLLKFRNELDPEKRGTLLNKLTDYNFAQFGAAGQYFSNEYNTVLTGLYSLENPTQRNATEQFTDNARKIEGYALIGDGPISLTTEAGLIDMNKVKKWYDGFPEKLRNALATPLAPGSKESIVTSFPDDAVRTTIQNFVNTYTSFQGTARAPEGVAPILGIQNKAYQVWRSLNKEERRILGAGKDVYRDSRSRMRYERLQPQLIQKIGADVFDFLKNEIAVGNL